MTAQRETEVYKQLIAAIAIAALGTTAASAQTKAAPKSASRGDVQKRLDARFTQIDANKDGALTKAEIDAERSKFVGFTRAVITNQVRQEFAAADKNKDGKASLDEMTAVAPAGAKAGTGKAFERLDANKDKGVTLAEFAAAAPPPRVPGSDDFLQRFDADKDGKVTRAEYLRPGLSAFDAVDFNKDGTITAAEKAKTRESR